VSTHHHLFSDLSDLYAAARPSYPEALFDFLRVQCEDLENCWDCATGSGQAAISLADIFEHVEATDVSAEQIDFATAHPHVTYSVQPAEHTNFADHGFDLITVAQALHWFDLESFWLEVDRVLKPGGVFAVWFYSWFKVNDEIDAVVEQKLLGIIAEHWAPQNRLAWDHYRDVDFPFAEIPTPKLALTPSWNLSELLSYLGTWSATRRCIEAQGDSFWQDFERSLQEVWGRPDRKREIIMDFHFQAGRKQS